MAKAVLLYRASCRRCRFLSRLAVALSFGAMRRIALSSDAAQQLYQQHPETRGKLALIDGEYVRCGLRVVPAGLALAARGLWQALLRRRRRATHGVTRCASRSLSGAP